MTRIWILLGTVAAYLPSAALPVLAHRSDVPGGPLDPAVLVVPFCVAFAAAFPLWGRVADRHAPVRVIAVALGLTAFAGCAVAIAPNEMTLIVARALQGAAAAGVPPAAQAALAAASTEREAGRAMSPMMLAVACAVLGGPAMASVVADAFGWTVAALLIGSALPLALVAGRTTIQSGAAPNAARRVIGRYDDVRGVRAGWVASACVLAGHWTVLTRIGEALGPGGLGAGEGWIAAAPLIGALGLPLVVLAARVCDRVGPRAPMAATLAVGALGFALAASAASAGMFLAGAGVGLAVYWAYLPVVAAQVQRSAGTGARGRAAGGLYASMWWAAGLAGAVASLAPSWQVVLAGAALMWGTGAIVACTHFIGAPAGARPDIASEPRTA